MSVSDRKPKTVDSSRNCDVLSESILGGGGGGDKKFIIATVPSNFLLVLMAKKGELI